MRRLAALLLVLVAAAAALADEDPDGTQLLELEVGKASAIVAPPGSRIVCDDPSLVDLRLIGKSPGFSIRGVAAGTTLCGIRQPQELPGGLYRVRVLPARDATLPAIDAGVLAATDAGVDDAAPGDADTGSVSTGNAEGAEADAGEAESRSTDLGKAAPYGDAPDQPDAG